MKLLAKAAEDRYQTAAGIEADLRACLTAQEKTRPDRAVSAGGAGYARSSSGLRASLWTR
jgi:hypothetical protein